MSRVIEVCAPEYCAGWTKIIVPEELSIEELHRAILAGEPWPQAADRPRPTYIKPSAIVALRVT